MNAPRPLSLVLLVLALGAAVALGAWSAMGGAGESALYRVEIQGPEGLLLDERVEVQEATVLRALEAAAAAHDIPLELERYPGMGTYVRAIGGHKAGGPSGWVYEVAREGVWLNGDRSAEFFALQKGDAVRWSWTAG